ncbi:hypothetical protein [Pseudonocardia sp. T1-2H]
MTRTFSICRVARGAATLMPSPWPLSTSSMSTPSTWIVPVVSAK